MSPVPQPATRTAWSEDPNPLRQEFRARENFYIHSISIAAHVAALGHEVHRITRDGRTIWRAPMAAKRDAERFTATLRALDRAMKQASQPVTNHDAR